MRILEPAWMRNRRNKCVAESVNQPSGREIFRDRGFGAGIPLQETCYEGVPKHLTIERRKGAGATGSPPGETRPNGFGQREVSS